ncbi:molybdopterin-guanine dinucleotide biosynthesis protein B [Paenibacillus thiaminolyticus]|nr:molybdopterin-guanine dinucleotide biosynthesis protein B [Paenibacillus thiaminolyticus]MCY9536003.1 molybdopterin-guanine dinucleotide biosynthesis protein B [Paenibacillus thiaminolyticus]MCY9602336.1 molybdopterin-guanine dinucleotide biosynthesis protein B [Paenibacillus thiaminolyticus]MCY9608731.1 molybdopterin-guanine dinucleotide biosynthesis protein B [Paenibacillus thiaminolyticus]MCY9613478.1 molybdopterin-guanine dinucleotide biosynthesis protein B [Paenibacillus thiaminolyticus
MEGGRRDGMGTPDVTSADGGTAAERHWLQRESMQQSAPQAAVVQIVGYKNSGKTTLACKLIAALTEEGYRVGTAKRDAHQFTLDDAGTDSARHLEHGAVETVLTSGKATRWMRQAPTSLSDIAVCMCGRVDIVIAEGFKREPFPKIALVRDPAQLSDLIQETTNVRLWISWFSPEAAMNGESDGSLPPLLSICDEEAVLDRALSVCRSLCSRTMSASRTMK